MVRTRTWSGGGFVPAVALVASIGWAPPQAQREPVFPGSGECRLPYEEVAGHLFVRGTIGASGPLWFTLDTGASLSLLDEACARRLGLALAPGRPIAGAGGTEHGTVARDVVLRLAQLELHEREL